MRAGTVAGGVASLTFRINSGPGRGSWGVPPAGMAEDGEDDFLSCVMEGVEEEAREARREALRRENEAEGRGGASCDGGPGACASGRRPQAPGANKQHHHHHRRRQPKKRGGRQYLQQQQQQQQHGGQLAKFEAQLEELHLGLRLMPGDGNCLFRALADQLEGDQSKHRIYRAQVVQYMRTHAVDFTPFLEDDVCFEEYLEDLSYPATYAGNDSIVAFARHHGVSVMIHQEGRPVWRVAGRADSNPARELHISYHNGNHFNSVRYLGDTTSNPADVILNAPPPSPSAFDPAGRRHSHGGDPHAEADDPSSLSPSSSSCFSSQSSTSSSCSARASPEDGVVATGVDGSSWPASRHTGGGGGGGSASSSNPVRSNSAESTSTAPTQDAKRNQDGKTGCLNLS
ncbi:uncharacterized protein LOC143035076 isoform X2 [Oratosquilla oratoria]|uniref:uncharacterized protein LOC143035076 isoform X2 n=1 Tax=Oratosquilla oratoria TaxID=337810 RepID=UPI003F76D456